MEAYTTFAGSFSTADAGHLTIDYRGDVLELRFVDWQEHPVLVRFPSTVAYRWQVEAALPPEVRDDHTYEVLNSTWLAELHQLGAAQSHHRHFKLCFNAQGVLDVISGDPQLPA